MAKVIIQGNGININLDVAPRADMIGCLFQGLICALPCFLECFMKCMQGEEPPADGFNPGTRTRC